MCTIWSFGLVLGFKGSMWRDVVVSSGAGCWGCRTLNLEFRGGVEVKGRSSGLHAMHTWAVLSSETI